MVSALMQKQRPSLEVEKATVGRAGREEEKGRDVVICLRSFLCIISPAYGILLYTWARRPLRISILFLPSTRFTFSILVVRDECRHHSKSKASRREKENADSKRTPCPGVEQDTIGWGDDTKKDYGVCTHLSLPEWKLEQMSADK
jgi:hypothetical protein